MSPKTSGRFPFARIVNTPRISYFLILIAAIASLGIGLSNIALNIYTTSTYTLIPLSFLCIVLLWINARGYYELAGLLLYLLVSGVVTFNIASGSGIYDEAMIAYPILIASMALIFGKRYITLVTLITIAEIMLVYFLSLAGITRPFKGQYPVHLEETFTTIIIMLVTGAVLYVVMNVIEKTLMRIMKSEFELERAYDLTLEAWAQALELRGREVKKHSQRVTALTVRLAARLGHDQEALKQIRRGALLHDIGKMGIPEGILLKSSPLTEEEWGSITCHTSMGMEVLKGIPTLEEALKVVCCHHERMDGEGYPERLEAEDIPVAARIFAVADNWDMLRSDRPYSKAWTDEEALAHIKNEAGRKFDPCVVEALIAILAEESRRKS